MASQIKFTSGSGPNRAPASSSFKEGTGTEADWDDVVEGVRVYNQELDSAMKNFYKKRG